MNLKKKLERYLRVNLFGPGPRLVKKEFTRPRSHKSWETLVYVIQLASRIRKDFRPDPARKLSANRVCKHRIIPNRQNVSHLLEYFTILNSYIT